MAATFDLDVLQQAAAEADAVVWTVMSLNPADYPGMEAALAALNDALAGTGKPLLCMGGGIVYSDTGDGAVGEDGPLDDTQMAIHALEVERVALEGAGRGVRSIAIRSSLVYGHGEGMFVRGPIDSARELGEARYVGSGAIILDDLATGSYATG